MEDKKPKKRKIEHKILEDGRKAFRYEGDINWQLEEE